MMMTKYDISELSLEIPSSSHETEYYRVMDRWESYHEKIQPSSMRRYGNRETFSFSKWLADCEDDRTTGSMLTNPKSRVHFIFGRR